MTEFLWDFLPTRSCVSEMKNRENEPNQGFRVKRSFITTR